MTTEKIIEASAVNVLQFIIHSMIEHAFLLAHENELSDLKDLIPADSFAEWHGEEHASCLLELSLLEMVTDPPVVMLMNAIKKIEHYITSYCLINELDTDDLRFQDQIREQSLDTWSYIMGTMKYQSYKEILEALGWMMERYGMLIWNLAQQQILGRPDVYLETELEFFDWDDDVASLNIENRNAKFLLEIYTDIQLDAAEIELFRMEYNGKI